MNSDKNILKVKILDIEYPLKVSENVDYVQQIARYVDSKMREIQAAKPDRPLHQIAILAALNIADELYQQKNFRSDNLKVYEERMEKLAKKLELGIKKSSEENDSLIRFDSDKTFME
ncbi:cell division protein ZapA [candidate division KSB1 bacterium]|nr:cell division protein ZapA [candidate division KSB1 bacterium]